jgi:hypothetical protein
VYTGRKDRKMATPRVQCSTSSYKSDIPPSNNPPTHPSIENFLFLLWHLKAFQMAEQFNIDQANPEARRAERDRQRRMVFALPRTTGIESFLANLGALHLDGQDRVQDALLILVDENINEGYGNVFLFESNTSHHVVWFQSYHRSVVLKFISPKNPFFNCRLFKWAYFTTIS